eukprot:TRINITY_DN2747_c0_g1_i1.p3 TRINITY_DN2747_c0_g1~~TRINITY_DN2747_c0_g1_i1.p3  ORF type:complete len:208 (+),score=-9.29 TRINITY_DN2747_c0_g1_i1:801-1424(+)
MRDDCASGFRDAQFQGFPHRFRNSMLSKQLFVFLQKDQIHAGRAELLIRRDDALILDAGIDGSPVAQATVTDIVEIERQQIIQMLHQCRQLFLHEGSILIMLLDPCRKHRENQLPAQGTRSIGSAVRHDADVRGSLRNAAFACLIIREIQKDFLQQAVHIVAVQMGIDQGDDIAAIAETFPRAVFEVGMDIVQTRIPGRIPQSVQLC